MAGNFHGWGTSSSPSSWSTLCVSLITGQGLMGNRTCQMFAVFASSCMGLTSPSCESLTYSGHVAKTEKQNKTKAPASKYLRMNFPSCLMWQGHGFPCPIEDLRICTHILNVSNNREADSNWLPDVCWADKWGFCEQGNPEPKPPTRLVQDLHAS